MQFCFTITRKKGIDGTPAKGCLFDTYPRLTADKFSRIFGFYRILDRRFAHQRNARIGFTA